MDWRKVIDQLHDDSMRITTRGSEAFHNGAEANGIADLAVAEVLLCLAGALIQGIKDE